MKKIKGHFCLPTPSDPIRPHPIKLALARSVRPSGPLKAERWTPKGECRKGKIFPQNAT